MAKLFKIDTPSLIINMDVVDKNLNFMQEKAQKYGVSLRPHIKAHKIPELAHMQLQKGAKGITASKVSEAEIMAAAGIKDIFIANQIVTPKKIERLVALSKQAAVSVGLDSRAGAEMLSQIAKAHNVVLDYLIEINCGLNRCGVLPGKPATELLEAIQSLPSIAFKGIFTHAGQAYAAPSIEDIRQISRHESNVMAQTAEGLREMGVPPAIVSVGSTPTMKVWEGNPAITEIRPGNYIFHDAMQVALGTAGLEECSLSMLATVISRPDPGRAVIDAGSKVLGLDKGGHGFESVKGFGMIEGKNGRPGKTVRRAWHSVPSGR